MVVDRLSLQHIGSVVEVTGGEALSTHTLGFTNDSLGQLRKVSLVSFGGKRYGTVVRGVESCCEGREGLL